VFESVPAYSEAPGGYALQIYNEAAFRHFLTIERRRAKRSMRPFLMVLVTIRWGDGSLAKLAGGTAVSLFGGLRASVREVDVLGWYREDFIAAAVLAQGPGASGAASSHVTERLLTELRTRLSPDQAMNVRVRTVRLGGVPAPAST
jgi:hypothetical protein